MTDFYERFCQTYHASTFFVDPSGFLEPLTRFLRPPASILDVGCGSGRDLLWLKKRGYQVKGLERAPGLAGLARKLVGCTVIAADFEDFDFSAVQVDALLLVGALVHVPKERMDKVLSAMLPALGPRGFLLLTLKEGAGVHQKGDGRIFHLWEDRELRVLFHSLNLEMLHRSRNESKLLTGETWLGYVLRKREAREPSGFAH